MVHNEVFRSNLALPPMNPDRITQIILFALAKARREDFGYGELGVIHLLKLLYLADHDYAMAHNGETYTGIPWVFYHFGPWSEDAWRHSVSVLEAPEIESREFITGAFERRTFRFRNPLEADERFFELEQTLPSVVTRAVGAAVHEYGSDTRRLLHHVYTTEPMRSTVPGNAIDFTGLSATTSAPTPQPHTPAPPLSKTQQKKAEEAKARLRESIAARSAARQAARYVPPPLDEKELEALNEITRLLAEDEDQGPTDLHGELDFPPEFWRSDFRREHGLS